MAAGADAGNNSNGNDLHLYFTSSSYYSQKVVLALYEKKLKFKAHFVNLSKGEQYQPWYMKLNSKGEVPTLKDGVKIIPDSARILDYLEDNFSNGDTPRLIPERGSEQAQKVKEMRELLDAVSIGVITFGCIYNPELTSGMRISGAERKMREGRYPALIELLDHYANKYPEFKEQYLAKKKVLQSSMEKAQNVYNVKKTLDDLETLLNKVEDELSTHKNEKADWWLCAEKFTLADISLAVLLHRLHSIGLWERYFGEEKRHHISLYFNRLDKRNSCQKTFQRTCLLSSCVDVCGKYFITAVGVASVLGIVSMAVILYRRSK